MKSERRHELQQNWLADRVARFAQDAKPYAKAVGGAILAVLVLVGAYIYIKSGPAEQANAWERTWHAISTPRTANSNSARLPNLWPHSPAGLWAQLYLADQELVSGVNSLFTEKSAGLNDIRVLLDGYQAVQASATDPFLQQCVHGIGRAQTIARPIGKRGAVLSSKL